MIGTKTNLEIAGENKRYDTEYEYSQYKILAKMLFKRVSNLLGGMNIFSCAFSIMIILTAH